MLHGTHERTYKLQKQTTRIVEKVYKLSRNKDN